MTWYSFLPGLLNMSLTAGAVILFVLLLRFLLKKAPKAISYALWGIVLIRLLCPVSFVSDFSLFGLMNAPTAETGAVTSRIEYVPGSVVHLENPADPLLLSGAGDVIPDALSRDEKQPAADPSEAPTFLFTCVWMAGVLVMGVYAALSCVQIRRKLLTASLLRENIYLADEIPSPFVMGVFRPKIYLPSSLEAREQSYILLHEQHHIRRFDHICKLLAFLALTIHWFNPLVWLAFILAGRDMEMSCDEAVVRKMGDDIRADYSASLLSLATGRRILAGMPLAFGEGNPKSRIRNLAKWKKPGLWITLAAAAVCAVLALCLLTNPKSGTIPDSFLIASAVYQDNLSEESVLSLSPDAAEALKSILNRHRARSFPVDLDAPNSLSSSVTLKNTDGAAYTVHYQYYSGFSFLYGKEDDYRAIVAKYSADGSPRKAWRMDFSFGADYLDWKKEYQLTGRAALEEPEEQKKQEETTPTVGVPDTQKISDDIDPDYGELFAACAEGGAPADRAERILRADRDRALSYCMMQFDAGTLEGLTFESTGTEMCMYRFWLSYLQEDTLENVPESPQDDWEAWSETVKRLYALNGYDEAVFRENWLCTRLYVQLQSEQEEAAKLQEILVAAEIAVAGENDFLFYKPTELSSEVLYRLFLWHSGYDTLVQDCLDAESGEFYITKEYISAVLSRYLKDFSLDITQIHGYNREKDAIVTRQVSGFGGDRYVQTVEMFKNGNLATIILDFFDNPEKSGLPYMRKTYSLEFYDGGYYYLYAQRNNPPTRNAS